MSAVQIVTTTPSRQLAEEIASRLVEDRLAACVQIDGPITSVFRWQGKVECDQEWRLTIKTAEDRFDAVAEAICRLHPYDVPEILCTAISRGSDAYVRWLDEQVRP